MDARKTSSGILPILICVAAVLWLLAACSSDAPGEFCGIIPFAWDNATMTIENSGTNIQPSPERIHEIRLKYDDLFWRQPNVWGVGEGAISDDEFNYLGWDGIVISVSEKVDQSTLPPEDRVPDCLEGVPVHIEERPPPVWAVR